MNKRESKWIPFTIVNTADYPEVFLYNRGVKVVTVNNTNKEKDG